MGLKNRNEILSSFIDVYIDDKNEMIEGVTFSKSKEFIDMRNYFERELKKMPISAPQNFDRLPKSSSGKNVWYKDRRVNELFIVFMWGFQYGRVY